MTTRPDPAPEQPRPDLLLPDAITERISPPADQPSPPAPASLSAPLS